MSDTLISFLEGFEPTNEVQTVLHTIFTIQAMFEKNNEDDLFFQTSKEMQFKLLEMAKKKYSLLTEVVNNGSLEQFNSHIQRIKDEIEQFTSEHEMNSITGQKVNDLNSQLKSVRAFIEAKEKYNTLKTLDELMKDERVLMEIFS